MLIEKGEHLLRSKNEGPLSREAVRDEIKALVQVGGCIIFTFTLLKR